MDVVVGSTPTLRAVVRDSAGDLTAATDITLAVMHPDGTVDDYVIGDLTNPSVGVYTQQVTVDVRGVWRWRWEATTAEGTDVDEGIICVTASPFVEAGS